MPQTYTPVDTSEYPLLNSLRFDRHNLPCWDKDECEGQTSCSVYRTPKPHCYCFKCGKTSFKLDIVESILTMTQQASSNNYRSLYSSSTPSKGNNLIMERDHLFPQKGVQADMPLRKISKETVDKFGVERLANPEGEPFAYAFPSYNKQGEFVAQKIKRFDGKMKWVGKPSEGTLFGITTCTQGGKFITITEGEEDAMSVYQILKEASPNFTPNVVSIKDGASAAARDCKNNWEFLNSFENIIVCFDGDKPGKDAAKAVSTLFPSKVKIVHFADCKKETVFNDDTGEEETKYVMKDANDYLKVGKTKEFLKMWWSAEKVVPNGVLTFKSLWDEMTRTDKRIEVSWPWKGLNDKLHALHAGDLVIVKAPPKIGKTSILKELVLHIRDNSEHNVGLFFLEDTKKSIGLGLCALKMSSPIHIPDVPFSMQELEEAHEHLSSGDRIMLFDPEGDRTAENVLEKILYFVKAHDVRFIILDHVSMLAYQSGDGDERRFLDKLLADLKAATTTLNIGIVAVIHVNDDGKTRGSRAPVQLCNALINLVRDKLNPDPVLANTLEIVVEENRLTGESGTACKLFYNRETGRLIELEPDFEVHQTQDNEQSTRTKTTMFDD